MADERTSQGRPRLLHGLTSLGGRAASATIRPFGDDLERALVAVAANPRIHEMLRRALYSDTAKELVDAFFDSGLFDHLADRLLASDGLWRIVDEVAQSPSVTAAISGQGLSFADQLGDELRSRSRRADVRVGRIARRMTGRDEQ